jgi:NAD+ diphosphatase
MLPSRPNLIPRPNILSGSPLDRASNRRGDHDWIARRMVDPGSIAVPVWRSTSLLGVAPDGAPAAIWPAAPALLAAGHPWAFLGLWQDRAVFAVDLSAAEEPLAALSSTAPVEADWRFGDLRGAAATLAPEAAAILAHARGLMHWRARHGFCGVCGTACAPDQAGNIVVCGACQTHHFPRTDPAVIMLVSKGDKVLLGNANRFPNTTMYSTLAGFLEPGESLEETVVREVLEETGVAVGNVTYHSSQPWPFPASLMVGFFAEALSEDIIIDPEEMRDARWFDRAELRDPQSLGIDLPGPISIARRLIEDWLASA